MIKLPVLSPEIKRALIRFARVFVASAVASMALVLPTGYADFKSYLMALGIAGIAGAIAGVDKLLRDRPMIQ